MGFTNLRIIDRNRPTSQPKLVKGIISPLDEKRGGTWMGVNVDDKTVTILTNLENDIKEMDVNISRGLVVKNFLENGSKVGNEFLQKNKGKFNGFQIVHVKIDEFIKQSMVEFVSNRGVKKSDLGRKIDPKSQNIYLNERSFVTITSSMNSFYEKKDDRLIDWDLMTSKFVEKFEGEKDIDKLTEGLGKLLNTTFVEEEKYCTRTQTIIVMKKNGELLYFHRNTDNAQKEKINELKIPWEVIKTKVDM